MPVGFSFVRVAGVSVAPKFQSSACKLSLQMVHQAKFEKVVRLVFVNGFPAYSEIFAKKLVGEGLIAKEISSAMKIYV